MATHVPEKSDEPQTVETTTGNIKHVPLVNDQAMGISRGKLQSNDTNKRRKQTKETIACRACCLDGRLDGPLTAWPSIGKRWWTGGGLSAQSETCAVSCIARLILARLKIIVHISDLPQID